MLRWSDDAKLLALYLMTCPHRNMVGYFVLPKPYICADLDSSGERLAEPFAELSGEGVCTYDEETRSHDVDEGPQVRLAGQQESVQGGPPPGRVDPTLTSPRIASPSSCQGQSLENWPAG